MAGAGAAINLGGVGAGTRASLGSISGQGPYLGAGRAASTIVTAGGQAAAGLVSGVAAAGSGLVQGAGTLVGAVSGSMEGVSPFTRRVYATLVIAFILLIIGITFDILGAPWVVVGLTLTIIGMVLLFGVIAYLTRLWEIFG